MTTKRILFQRTDGRIGDLAIMIRSVELTRLRYPEAQIFVQCLYPKLIEAHPAIDKIYEVGADIPEVDFAINQNKVCGEYEFNIPVIAKTRHQIFCDNVAEILDDDNLRWDGLPQTLWVDRKLYSWANETIMNASQGRIPVGVFWRAATDYRSWKGMNKLISLLSKDFAVFCFDDKKQLNIRKRIHQFVGFSLDLVLALVSQLRFIVSNDSAGAHLAGGLGIPLWGMFGPTDPLLRIGMYHQAQWMSILCPKHPCWYNPCKKLLCFKEQKANKIFRQLKEIIPKSFPVEGFSASLEITPRKAAIQNKTQRKIIKKHIALMRLDGLGGTLTLSDQAKKIKEMTEAEITLIIRHYPELFDDNPHVDHIITVGRINWDDCLQTYKDKFTALADVRMAIGKWYDPTNIFHQDFTAWESYYEQFPLNQQELTIYGLHHIQLTDKILSLPFDTIDSKIYFELSLPQWFTEENYICICPGVDVIHDGKQQTKCWDYWNELVKKIDMPVVQLGTANDKGIDGTIDLREKTTIKEAASLLSRASAIVTVEGGLMHLAFASGQQNVIVLFGPTAGSLFLYPSHVHIDAFPCQGCFSTIENWAFECKEEIDVVCMKSITPERVVYACNRLLGRQSNEIVVANTRFSGM
ncbi:MAG: glycosyltransferase family 9 protein [Planctomycetota bacterium]|jgi:ADP-heptose:LPS heptosyltransferase